MTTYPYPYSFQLRWAHKPTATGTANQGLQRITNLSSTAGFAVGQVVTGLGIPAGTTILTLDTVNMFMDLSNAVEIGGTFGHTEPIRINAQGFQCVPFDTGSPWSIQMYSQIPNRLSVGGDGMNEGSNVGHSLWQHLHRGGMGALEATDLSLYRYAMGLYTGDDDEIYLQPQASEVLFQMFVADVIDGQTVITADADHDTQLVNTAYPIYAYTAAGVLVASHSVASADAAANTVTLATAWASGAQTDLWWGQYALEDRATVRQVLSWYNPARSVLAAPGGITANGVTEGNYAATAATTVYYFVTAISASGAEGVASAASTSVIFSTSGTIIKGARINWNEVAGAVGYNVYRGHDATASNARLVSTVGASTTRIYSTGSTALNPYRFLDTWVDTAANVAPPTADDMRSMPNASSVPLVVVLVNDQFNYTNIFLGVKDQTGPGGGTTVLGAKVRRTAAWPHNTTASGKAYSFEGTVAFNAATVYQNRLFLPAQNAGGTKELLCLAWNSSVAGSELRYKTVTGYPPTRVFADSNKRLWMAAGNVLYWTGDPLATTPSWTGPIHVGSGAFPCQSFAVYGGAGGEDSALFIAQGDGLYRILNTSDGPNPYAEKVSTLGSPSEYNGTFMCEHRGELYIGVKSQVMRYSLSRVDASDPNENGGLPTALRGYCWDGVSTGNHFYLLYRSVDNFIPGLSYYGYQQILETKEGAAWHQVHHSCGSMDWFSNEAAGFSVGGIDDRWVGRVLEYVTDEYTGNYVPFLYFTGGTPGMVSSVIPIGGNQLFRIPLRNGDQRLRDVYGYTADSRYTPIADEGLIRFPVLNAGDGAVSKNWHWVQVPQSLVTQPASATLAVHAEAVPTDHAIPQRETSEMRLVQSLIANKSVVINGTTYNGRFIAGDADERIFLPHPQATVDQAPWCAEGMEIELRVDANVATPVLSSLLVTHSPANLSLRRWTFNTVIAKNQLLHGGVAVQNTQAEVNAVWDALRAFSENTGTIILTDPWGDEATVRVDLNPQLPEQWEMRKLTDNTVEIEAQSVLVTVVCTELVERSRV